GGAPRQGHIGLPLVDNVQQRIYSGADVSYETASGQIAVRLSLEAGLDPATVRIAYSGARELAVDSAGALVITTSDATIVHTPPTLTQIRSGRSSSAAGSFRMISGDTIAVDAGGYDTTLPTAIEFRIASSASTAAVSGQPVMNAREAGSVSPIRVHVG